MKLSADWIRAAVVSLACCRSVGKRLRTALIWVVASAVVCGLVLGILYGACGSIQSSSSPLPPGILFCFVEEWSEILITVLVQFKKCGIFCLNLESDSSVSSRLGLN